MTVVDSGPSGCEGRSVSFNPRAYNSRPTVKDTTETDHSGPVTRRENWTRLSPSVQGLRTRVTQERTRGVPQNKTFFLEGGADPSTTRRKGRNIPRDCRTPDRPGVGPTETRTRNPSPPRTTKDLHHSGETCTGRSDTRPSPETRGD